MARGTTDSVALEAFEHTGRLLGLKLADAVLRDQPRPQRQGRRRVSRCIFGQQRPTDGQAVQRQLRPSQEGEIALKYNQNFHHEETKDTKFSDYLSPTFVLFVPFVVNHKIHP